MWSDWCEIFFSFFQLRSAFRVVLSPDLQQRAPQLGSALFEVVDAWPVEDKLRFVRYVTGVPRPPARLELLQVSAPFAFVLSTPAF